MKRRVNIAAALLHRPRLLFLDEPTVGVDPQSRNHIFESIRRLNAEFGMTVVYTSHYMEEVETLCERVAIIDHGQLIACGTQAELVAQLGGDLLYLGLSACDEQVLDALRALPTLLDVEPVEPLLLKCRAANAQQALLELIPTVTGLGLRLTSLEISEPNLESVFLHLTGKKLRD
jgi:ABC-2 type transport system ATP-binding protein